MVEDPAPIRSHMEHGDNSTYMGCLNGGDIAGTWGPWVQGWEDVERLVQSACPRTWESTSLCLCEMHSSKEGERTIKIMIRNNAWL